MSLRHNKKRSTGIVYELLIRKISQSLIEENRNNAKKALKLIKKYFSSNTPIGQELEAMQVLMNSRGFEKSAAQKILSEVSEVSKKLDRKTIEVKKSNLIKEINYSFGKDFFSEFKIPEYKALASMQVYIESFSKSQMLSESVDRIKIEEAILCFMCSPVLTETHLIDYSRNKTSYMLALKKFEEKYKDCLNDKQQKLLETYVYGTFSGDFKKFREVAIQQKAEILETIKKSNLLSECKSDKVLMDRLNEAAVKIKMMPVTANEEFVGELMLYHDLCKEISSNE